MNSHIKSKIGVVSFNYIPLNLLGVLEGIFSSNTTDKIQQLHDRYVLISNDEKNKLYHDCPMMDFLKKDIDDCGNNRIQEFYKYFIDKYPKEVVDLLIIEDENIIKSKILHMMNFAMNDIYKSNIIKVEFIRYTYQQDFPSSIPKLIYSTAGENFDIKGQYLVGQSNYVIIKRRY